MKRRVGGFGCFCLREEEKKKMVNTSCGCDHVKKKGNFQMGMSLMRHIVRKSKIELKRITDNYRSIILFPTI